jgi:hypothetical protein
MHIAVVLVTSAQFHSQANHPVAIPPNISTQTELRAHPRNHISYLVLPILLLRPDHGAAKCDVLVLVLVCTLVPPFEMTCSSSHAQEHACTQTLEQNKPQERPGKSSPLCRPSQTTADKFLMLPALFSLLRN